MIGLVEFAAIWWQLDNNESRSTGNGSGQTNQSVNQPIAGSFDKTRYSINEASSIWVVVNKGRVLSSSYIPDGLTAPNISLRYSAKNSEMRLRADAAKSLEELVSVAAKDGIYLRLASGYRSYSSQSTIYAREVKTYGQVQADRQSARPGHSEHQTGLAADLSPKDGRCEIADCFASTPEGKWLAGNAYRFGFILRYPPSQEEQTGYRYEPWHYRYVGNELAAAINQIGQTLERLFELQSFTSYPAEKYQLR
ncbi:MAG TPA: M15 family metallopeptidase [Candidatus Saccharimonadales bacterium]